MNLQQLQRTIVDALEDVKAQDIKVFSTTHMTAMFDRVVIASGTSNRQTKALAASVRDSVKASGGQIISTEGEDTGEWVLVDCGDAIVHIMQPAIRQYYHLEDLWGEKPVAIKRAAVADRSRRHATEDAPAPAAKKTAAAKRAPAKKAAKSSTSAAAKTPAKKTTRAATSTAAKKTAKRAPVTRPITPPVRKPLTRTAGPARKTAARKSAKKA